MVTLVTIGAQTSYTISTFNSLYLGVFLGIFEGLSDLRIYAVTAVRGLMCISSVFQCCPISKVFSIELHQISCVGNSFSSLS